MTARDLLGVESPDWYELAECRGAPQAIFFPERGESTKPAKDLYQRRGRPSRLPGVDRRSRMSAPNVIGLDLSITATGIAHADGRCSTVGGKADRGDRRLVDIAEAVTFAIGIDGWLTKNTLVVIEDIPTHAHGAGITAMVHGAVRARLVDQGTPYALVPPASLKKYATGKGNAGKPDMAVALYKRAGLELGDDNQVDAWWLRAAGLHHLGHPIVDVPATHAEALDRITWPTTPTKD